MAHLSLAEVQERLSEMDGWEYGDEKIFKTFNFDSSTNAMVFVNEVANLAEQHQHHPDIMIRMKDVTIELTTHSEHGLTGKDFEVAKQIDLAR
jgi:4a-hydroxytetrahydrobiopterin dehydratase